MCHVSCINTIIDAYWLWILTLASFYQYLLVHGITQNITKLISIFNIKKLINNSSQITSKYFIIYHDQTPNLVSASQHKHAGENSSHLLCPGHLVAVGTSAWRSVHAKQAWNFYWNHFITHTLWNYHLIIKFLPVR